MKAVRKPTAKQLDKVIESMYYKRCSGVQIDIMDISRVFKVARSAYEATNDLAATEAALVAFVETIRKN